MRPSEAEEGCSMPRGIRRYLLVSGFSVAAVIVGLFLLGLLVGWRGDLSVVIFVIGPILFGVVAIGAAALAIYGIVLAFRVQRLVWRAVAGLGGPLLILAASGLALPAISAGRDAGAWLRFSSERPRYDAIVAKLRAAPGPSGEQRSGIMTAGETKYLVEWGPPVRVAFDPDGILDNWSAIIFDPSGDVMQADGFDRDGKFVASRDVTGLFGGDLVRCRPLADDYYYCAFT